MKGLYEDPAVALSYIRERFTRAWSRLLHRKQVQVLNDLVATHCFQSVLELAPWQRIFAAFAPV